MEALTFLQSVAGYVRAQDGGSPNKPVKLGVVDPAYAGAPALPKVTFDGEDTMSAKEYAWSGAAPAAGDRVALIPVGTTYLIVGAIGAVGGSSMPLVRLVQPVAQTLTHAANAALTFGTDSEEIDTHGFHSTTTNTSRVTPTVPGYYRCRAHLHMAAGANNLTQLVIGIAKNGTRVTPHMVYRPDLSVNATSASSSAIVSCNGSTDYIEAIANQQNSGSTTRATSVASPFQSSLEVEYLRAL
jgi:hypothetical protein